jgi:hypothetical protein
MRVSKSSRVRALRKPLPPQSVLIIHFDAAHLRADGLHLGSVACTSAVVSKFLVDSDVELRDVSTPEELESTMGAFRKQRRKFDLVVVIAHSNERVIRMAHETLAPWSDFATWVRPLRPRRLVLVACKAGRWPAAQTLFGANRDLTRIYGCPANVTKDLGAYMVTFIPYLAAHRRPKDSHVRAAQLLTMATTGLQLREWKRTADKDQPMSALYDLFSDVAHPFIQQLRSPPRR